MRKVGIVLLIIGVIAALGGYYMLQEVGAVTRTTKGALVNALDRLHGGDQLGEQARVCRTVIAGGIGATIIGLALALFGTKKTS